MNKTFWEGFEKEAATGLSKIRAFAMSSPKSTGSSISAFKNSTTKALPSTKNLTGGETALTKSTKPISTATKT